MRKWKVNLAMFNFLTRTQKLSQIFKVHQNPHKIFADFVYNRSLWVNFAGVFCV